MGYNQLPAKGFDFVEQMRYVVQATEDAILSDLQYNNENIQAIGYLYGTAKEINRELELMAKSSTDKFKRFPLIAIVEPITISQPKDGTWMYAHGFDLLICMSSDKDWSSVTRQNENVVPILLPIYEEFFKQLAKTRSIVCQNPKKDLAHSSTIHKGALFFSQWIDLIEIKGLEVKINQSFS